MILFIFWFDVRLINDAKWMMMIMTRWILIRPRYFIVAQYYFPRFLKLTLVNKRKIWNSRYLVILFFSVNQCKVNDLSANNIHQNIILVKTGTKYKQSIDLSHYLLKFSTYIVYTIGWIELTHSLNCKNLKLVLEANFIPQNVMAWIPLIVYTFLHIFCTWNRVKYHYSLSFQYKNMT